MVIRNAWPILGLVVIVSGVLFIAWGVQHVNDPPTPVNWHESLIPVKPRFAVGIGDGIALVVLGTIIVRTRRR